ncbi:MAG: tetratricopeptide repeat protein [Armatimonadota bacterium]|nr:tetratricopeptide repeat protein [Armatimonadota bacterium]MDR7450390.1 tetratricopeptide repeat protein [Armatimonadota bacterium]MDR7467027.1 tetratricopeptide repeat protein [Armatimonadota bacterium]MDR7493431.1 tetratricopeptide repeat protein [Armatimonadota bacterium]MDR7498696.1 tetratricopeptide repeat protein [Armatimonadota bacterium]
MRRALFVLLLLGVAWVPTAAAQAPAPAQPLPPFDTLRFYDQARFEAAIAPYAQAVARNANDARAHYWLGVAYLHAARLHRFGLAPWAADHAGRAVASLERALQLQPAIEVMLVLADAYALVGAQDKLNELNVRLAALARPQPLR